MVDEETIDTDYFLSTDDGNYRSSERGEYEALESAGALNRTVIRDGAPCDERFEGRCLRLPCFRAKPRWVVIAAGGAGR